MRAKDRLTGQERDVTENDVVVNGEIVGTDPDPNVREQLRREAQVNREGD
jgi:hypothetical protein